MTAIRSKIESGLAHGSKDSVKQHQSSGINMVIFRTAALLSRRTRVVLLLALPLAATLAAVPMWGRAQNELSAPASTASAQPRYDLSLAVDYDLLTLKGKAAVRVPATAADPLHDTAFFLFANASGVGGDDPRRKNLVVDAVTLDGAPLSFQLEGAVLKARLPAPRNAPFVVQVDWHGVVPRAPAGAGTDMMGALGGDISGLLGMGTEAGADKPKNTDYGLYTYGNGILSLGSFWYPQLAVREPGKWASAPPEGLGDVAYAEESDYTLALSGVPRQVMVVAPGSGFGFSPTEDKSAAPLRRFSARGLREFAVLMSEDFTALEKTVTIGGRPVTVTSVTTKKHAGKSARALDIAVGSLQVFAKRFGPYNFPFLKVVEAPMRGGAGGMEYSAVVGIASMLYGDMQQQMKGIMSSLSLPGAEGLLKGLEADAGFGTAAPPQSAAKPAPARAAASAPAGGEANPMMDMVGGMLGQQQGMMESMLETTIAHEVAHQWWAIGVGSNSQQHPFVDESLTNWSAMLYFEDRYGKEMAAKMSQLHLKTSFSMGIMLGGGDKAANLATSAYKNNLQYGAVIYGKGALFYAELRKLMGDEAFFGALRDYYGRYNGKIARPQSLRSLMGNRAPAKKAAIEALYTRWVEGAHGQEDIGGGLGGLMGGLDIQGLLGGLMGGLGGAGE